MPLRFLCLFLFLGTAAAAQTPDLVWMRGGGGSNDARWAPDGRTFALAGEDGTVKVFDGTTRFLIQTLRVNDAPLTEVAYAPDGSRVAFIGEDSEAGVWDLGTGEAVWTASLGGRPSGVAFSPDGALLAVGRETGVQVRDAATGSVIRTLSTSREVGTLAFSPDGQRIAAGSGDFIDPSIWIWRVSDGVRERTLTNGPELPTVAFSPDGTKLAAAGGDLAGSIGLWTVATGQYLRTIYMGDSLREASYVGFSPDGQHVFAGHPYEGVKVFNAATGALVSHVPEVVSIRVAPDGQTFIGQPKRCGDPLYRWASFSFPAGQLLDEFMTHTGTVNNLDVSNDGSMIATASPDGFARVWDTGSAERLQELEYSCASATLHDIAFSPDASLIAGGGLCFSCELLLWNRASGASTVLGLGHNQRVDGLAFSPDGTQLATGSTYHKSYVVSPDGFLVHEVLTGAVHDLAYSRDGSLLAFGTWSSGIDIVDAGTGAILRSIPTPHTGGVQRVAFSSDNALLVSGGDDGLVKVWSVADGTLVRTMAEEHPGPVMALALSPDDRHVVSGGAGAARLWDLATGARLRTYTDETAGMMDAEFLPDGTAFAFSREDAAVGVSLTGLATASEPAVPEVTSVSLSAAHPNPFSGQTALTLSVRTPQHVAVAVYDALGRRVTTVYDGEMDAGARVLAFDGSALPAGVYVVRATAGEGETVMRRLVLAR